MLDLFFSFRGRIGRLQYFLSATSSIVIIVAAATLGLISISWKENPVAAVLALVGLVALMAIGAVWSNLALQARRIRDIGLDPVIVIPAYLGLHFVLTAATPHLGHGIGHGLGHGVSPLAAVLSLAYSGALLLWPGRAERTPDIAAIFGGEPEVPLGRHASPAPALLRPPAASPVSPRPGRPAKTFGRRGLA